jgi:hypothetical protein
LLGWLRIENRLRLVWPNCFHALDLSWGDGDGSPAHVLAEQSLDEEPTARVADENEFGRQRRRALGQVVGDSSNPLPACASGLARVAAIVSATPGHSGRTGS